MARLTSLPRPGVCFAPTSLDPVCGEAAVDWQADPDDEARTGAAHPQHSRGNLLCATQVANPLPTDDDYLSNCSVEVSRTIAGNALVADFYFSSEEPHTNPEVLSSKSECSRSFDSAICSFEN
jgi:hypothetical protein